MAPGLLVSVGAMALTRGPLPARVYWRRRAVALLVLAGLVFGLVKVVDLAATLVFGGSDQTAGAVATDTSGDQASPSPTPKPSPSPSPTAPGPCDPEDIAVTPQVRTAVAGPRGDIAFLLRVRTLSASACTWRVSPESLIVKISSGGDAIWSSQQCPKSITIQEMVLRRDVATTIRLPWNGRRSAPDCPRDTAFALPGYYHLVAAALAGEPTDRQFELVAPSG